MNHYEYSVGKVCLFYHRWETLLDNGFTKYQQCKKCNSRRILQNPNGYQPVDTDWLFGKNPEKRVCNFCHKGVVTPCTCGCCSNGAGTYLCSNKDCTGDVFQILGI